MGWKRIQMSNRCKYLGFWIDPGAGEASHVSWQGPFKKFVTRVSQWSCFHLGLPLNALVFNTLVVPVLEFVCQLCPVQAEVESKMLFAMRKFASGPGNLIIINDLECLSYFCMHTNFRLISATAQAAKLRVINDILHDLHTMMSSLQVAHADNWRRPFGQWHYTSFVEVLHDTSRRLRTQDITIESIQRSR